MTDKTTYKSFIQSFTDFLTVAIHTIIYERNLYDHDSFLSARKYNFSVRQSRHPQVCTWINDVISAVQVELLKGTVARVVVMIYDCATNHALERFVFDTARFPVVPAAEHETPLTRVDEKGETVSVLPAIELEEQLRATMSRLSGCGAALGELPETCTFTIAVELKDDSEPPIRHPQAWIPVSPELQKTVRGVRDEMQITHGEALGGARTVPVRAVTAGEMSFEVWIEEGQAKLDHKTTAPAG